MPILENISFVYDGRTSDEMGLYNVQVDNTGMFEEPFIASREIKEVQTKGKSEPYFQGVTCSPLSFSFTFAFKNSWDNAKIREVARWLNQDMYKEFYMTDNLSKIYMCMMVSSSTLLHNGLSQGYVKLEMRCDSPWAYSPIYTAGYDFTNNPVEGTNLTFINNGDMICLPEIWIKKVGGTGDVSIFNTTNGNSEFKFTGLANNETVYVDCENEHIETDINGMYRYNNFNNEYLELVLGNNILKIVGKCTIDFRYRFKLLQG